MKLNSSIVLFLSVSALAAQVACGGAAGPTGPAPTPVPTPTPLPSPTPDPSIPPEGSGCGQPYPPELFRIAVKVHVKAPEYWTLDSTPIVGPDAPYCREIGYTDGRDTCPVRLEQDAERKACEAWVMGPAEDTGIPGPTWFYEWDQYCTTFEASGCEHSPDNPYALRVRKGGWYQACRREICGEVEVDK